MPAIVNTEALDLGAANVYLFDGTDDVFVGGTGVVEVQITQSWENLETEQTGVANKVLQQSEVQITVPLREVNLDNFQRALASVTTFDKAATPGEIGLLEIGGNLGQDLLSFSKKLTIKPIIGGVETTDNTKWIIAEKAAPATETMSLAFARSGQREITAVFYCLPVTDKGNRRIYMGDSTLRA